MKNLIKESEEQNQRLQESIQVYINNEKHLRSDYENKYLDLQNKLLEAMAMKMPCITSSLANNALKATNELNILIANNVEEYKERRSKGRERTCLA